MQSEKIIQIQRMLIYNTNKFSFSLKKNQNSYQIKDEHRSCES